MQIAIFEKDHFEVAYTLIKLFDNGQNKITVFTYEESYRQFAYLLSNDMKKYTWIVKSKSASEFSFIKCMYAELNKGNINLLYLNTVSSNFILYAGMILLLKKLRIILTIHDINGYFKFKPALSIRRFVRFAGKQWLIQNVKEFNVLSNTMVDLLKQKLPPYKKIHNIPGSFFDERHQEALPPEKLNSIQVVIPGTIDPRRRNYEFVLSLLEQINKKNLKISFVLLGGINNAYGKNILEKCRAYASENDNLQFYEADVVDQPEFDRIMEEAHLALLPTEINTMISDGISETYGLSISSGNIFDVIKHAKPFISPVELQIPVNIQTSGFRYSTKENIIDFLESLIVTPGKYAKLKAIAIQNSMDYTLDKIRHKNPSLFTSPK